MTHGPHPGAYEGSVGARTTNEVAVMLDCHQPLARTPEALEIEDGGYQESLVKRGQCAPGASFPRAHRRTGVASPLARAARR